MFLTKNPSQLYEGQTLQLNYLYFAYWSAVDVIYMITFATLLVVLISLIVKLIDIKTKK